MSLRTLRGDHCMCSTCGEHFNSTSAFDPSPCRRFHARTANYGRRCLTPELMLAKGMLKNTGGWWISSRSTFSRDSVGRDRASQYSGTGANREPEAQARLSVASCKFLTIRSTC
jgi:hypothetical protein